MFASYLGPSPSIVAALCAATAAIRYDVELAQSDISVTYRQGVFFLEGTASDLRAINRALIIARSILPSPIANHLTIANSGQSDDAEHHSAVL